MIYIICRQEDEVLTGIGLDISESAAKAIADDGDFVVIPIQIGKKYDNIISAGIVGATSFENTGLQTLVNQVKNAILSLRSDIETLQDQMLAGTAAIQNLNQSVVSLDARVTALEG